MSEAHPSPDPPQPPTDPLQGEAQSLYAALLLLGQGTRANNVLECGHAFYAVYCHDCTQTTQVWLSCHLRLCSNCARRLASLFIARHTTALSAMKRPKLLTLTFRSTNILTREHITRYLKCLSKLRHRKFWKDNVDGGLSGLELTWGPPGWHPHLHLLIDSHYLPRPQLIDIWKAITGGAWHVDIRQISTLDGVYEVAKYTAKGHTFYRQPHLLDQFLRATKKRRFLSAFGSVYAAGTDPLPVKEVLLNPFSDGPVESDIYGPSFIPRCVHCGSRHIENLGRHTDMEISRPPVQIPF